MTSAEVALELAARRLEGDALRRVLERRAVGSAVVDAVVLELASGRRVEVRWADELGLRHGFGVALRELAVVDGELRVADWGPRLGTRISRAAIHWASIEADLRSSFIVGIGVHADHSGRADYPRALDLSFADGSAASIETRFTSSLSVVLR